MGQGEQNNGSGFPVGFVVGLFIGLAVALLYAPRPGRETRALLKERAEVAKEKAEEAVEKLKRTASGERSEKHGAPADAERGA